LASGLDDTGAADQTLELVLGRQRALAVKAGCLPTMESSEAVIVKSGEPAVPPAPRAAAAAPTLWRLRPKVPASPGEQDPAARRASRPAARPWRIASGPLRQVWLPRRALLLRAW